MEKERSVGEIETIIWLIENDENGQWEERVEVY
jgi:hypothetical protein